MSSINCLIPITDSTFHHNSGSLHLFNSNLTVSDYTTFENCGEPSNKTVGDQEEGGAITSSVQSTVIFTGVSSLSNNQARHGGAILAIESKIIMYGETTIAMATTQPWTAVEVVFLSNKLTLKSKETVSSLAIMLRGVEESMLLAQLLLCINQGFSTNQQQSSKWKWTLFRNWHKTLCIKIYYWFRALTNTSR